MSPSWAYDFRSQQVGLAVMRDLLYGIRSKKKIRKQKQITVLYFTLLLFTTAVVMIVNHI